MAEVLATILTVTAAGIGVGRLFHALVKSWKDAPVELAALVNEITDVNLVMDMAKEVLNGTQGSKVAVEKIIHLFERANLIFAELSDISSSLNKAVSADNSTRARASWFKNKSKIQLLHRKLREAKVDIMGLKRNFHLANKFLGALFIGYRGLPRTSADCNEWACQRRSQSALHLAYVFPTWFFQYAVHVLFSTGGGPQMTLAVAFVIPATAESFEHIWTGNVNAAKVLFSAGNATPMDVDDMDGSSYLTYALRSRKRAISRFIFELPGTNPALEDQQGECPIDVAWQLLLSHKAEPESEDWLKARLADPEHLQGRQFTTLHKIVCGLSPLELEKILQTSTAAVNSMDSGGWTPLHWASYCRNWEAVGLLLSFGANADIRNRKGHLALHMACREGAGNDLNPQCLANISNLIMATSNVNVKDVYGDTPLMYAAEHGNDPRILEILYKAGSSLSEVDCTGHTAMHTAIYFDNWRAVETLVGLGADIDRPSSGDTPLMKTLICNAHASMSVLFRLKADVRLLDLEGQSLLHLAARYGDAESLQILSIQPTLSLLDPDLMSDGGQTAEQVFSESRLLPPDEAVERNWQKLIAISRHEWQRKDSSFEKPHDVWSSDEEASAEQYYDAVE
ncbi:MAG: hypothetical protein Q9210_000611 [Variospora velana]